MCWTLVPGVLQWRFLYLSFPFLFHQSEHQGGNNG